MTSYLDFELEIARVSGGYRARVIDAPTGRRAQVDFKLPSGASRWEGGRISRGRGRSQRNVFVDSPADDGARALGEKLFERIFGIEPIQSRWQTSLDAARAERKGLRLRLRLPDDPTLLEVPWELLYDPDTGFLAHSEETPIVRSLEVAGRRRPMRVDKEPVRLLALLSCPPDVTPLQVEKEWEALEQALASRVTGGQMTLEHLSRPTLPELHRYLRTHGCHILHFIGHGICGRQGGALAFENRRGEAQWIDYDKLAAFFSHRSLRLVILNACEGARPGRIDPLAGVAQALVRRGVPGVIAMQREVADDVAIDFTHHFYSALAEGLPIDAAMSRARFELFAAYEGPAWAIPVLYMTAREGDVWPQRRPIPPWAALIGIGCAALLAIGSLFLQMTRGPRPPVDWTSNPESCPSRPDLGIAFALIPAGDFPMGEKRGEEKTVPITKPFCLGRYEVTRELWNRVLGIQEELPAQERDLPVQGVTFDEAQQFVDRLNKIDPSGHYRLPTEAEWEYGARAGTRTRYIFGDDAKDLVLYGNCKGNDLPSPAPVGRLKPNPWGLYDMYGNVFEWVSDGYGTDPDKRIRRGGSWESGARACSSGARSEVKPTSEYQENGFRIVREIP